MAKHEHGSMNIEAHEKTFAGFVTFTTRCIIVIILTVIFMALVNA